MKRVQDLLLGFFALLGTAQKSLLVWLLSFNPNVGRKEEEVAFNWEDWRATVNLPHVVIALDTIIGVWVIYSTVEFFLPFTKYSILTAIVAVLNLIWQTITKTTTDVSGSLLIVVFILLILFRQQVSTVYGNLEQVLKRLPQLAMREEVLFRKWSEKMRVSEMARSCLSFGAAHFAMLIVPVAALPALAFAGAIFMAV